MQLDIEFESKAALTIRGVIWGSSLVLSLCGLIYGRELFQYFNLITFGLLAGIYFLFTSWNFKYLWCEYYGTAE